MPSVGPTLAPSDGPTLMPSSVPSGGPTLSPSSAPTMSPSVPPTDSPSSASVPTKLPTACSTLDIACNSDEFSILCDALHAADLDDLFGDYNRTFTVFAPTDTAFVKLGEAALAYLMDPKNKDLLSNILAFHTIEDEMLYSEDLECTELLEMANGRDSRTVCRGDSVFQKGAGNTDEERPEIIDADIETCNSVIHVVDEVMLYKSPEKLRIPDKNATVPPKGPRGPPPGECKPIGT